MSTTTEKLLQASWKITQDDKGLTGQLSVVVPRTEIFDSHLPVPGDPWPLDEELPYLRCKNAEWQPLGTDGVVQCTYYYTTDRMLGDEFAEVSSDWSGEVVDQTKGYVWETAGTPVQEDIPSIIPLIEYTMRVRVTAPPYEAISAAINCVNDRVFRGFAAGCLRFEGANTSESYDIRGQLISCNTTYKFTGRRRSWQEVWRPPLIARDGDGRERYYQGQDETKPDYSPTQDGQPVYVSGAAGQGGWDRPKLGSACRYPVCDFATMLGLPKLLGDE